MTRRQHGPTPPPWRRRLAPDRPNLRRRGELGTNVRIALALAANGDHHDGRREPARLYVCESIGKDHRYRDVGNIRQAEVKRQLSRNPCECNRSWGHDRCGTWVGDGWRAESRVE